MTRYELYLDKEDNFRWKIYDLVRGETLLGDYKTEESGLPYLQKLNAQSDTMSLCGFAMSEYFGENRQAVDKYYFPILKLRIFDYVLKEGKRVPKRIEEEKVFLHYE